MQFIPTGTLEGCQNDSILTETLSDFFKSESGRFEPTTPGEREKERVERERYRERDRQRERDWGRDRERDTDTASEILNCLLRMLK